MATNIDDDLDPRVLVETLETLQGMSIDELEDYIGGLESGIARAREVITEKKKHLTGAEGLFKN